MFAKTAVPTDCRVMPAMLATYAYIIMLISWPFLNEMRVLRRCFAQLLDPNVVLCKSCTCEFYMPDDRALYEL